MKTTGYLGSLPNELLTEIEGYINLVTVNIYFSHWKQSLIFHGVKVYSYPSPEIIADDEIEDHDNVNAARDINTHFGKLVNKDINPNSKLIVLNPNITFHNFNGTGYHYQDMKLTIPGMVDNEKVHGYTEFVVEDPSSNYSPIHYLYEFSTPTSKNNYLSIFQIEGWSVRCLDTMIVILLN